jgi:Dockerin type I domain/Alpha amylase, catalytic domain
MPDLFQAGYGAVWLPPPYRGDTSDLTVGYDVYNRFDLGQWNKPTLYGTEDGIKYAATMLHRTGMDLHVDFVMNHNGYSDNTTPGFYEAGGYPGLNITLPYDYDGDFHSVYWGGPEYERLAGLIDIAHEKNYQFIRNPVDPNNPQNIRPGTVPAYGRIATVPAPNNARFYPDIGHNTIYLYDPVTGEQNIPVSQFNLENPLAGDAVPENAMGYLMRNAQWLVQTIGVDGLRIDAGKHMQGFVFDYLDRAVYRSSLRTLLDGSPKNVFSYTEVYDANPAVLLPHVKKNIDPNDIGKIGGNRDTLDFKWYFAVKDNLEHYGQPNAWYNVKDAGLDVAYSGGLHNGSAGVKFTVNHDVYKPYQLDNVANALMLMLPGNAAVYFNGKEFGDNRDFPKDGRQDAMSVGNGSLLTTLLNIRETHGRGNYQERWVDDQGIYVFERVSSALVGLSNRGDGGFDTRTVQVALAPGTLLVELTGNAADPVVDPPEFNNIEEVLTVWESGGNSYVTMHIPRNFNAYGVEHQRGYVIYGLGTPYSDNGLELNGVDSVLSGDTNITNNYDNGTKRQSDVYVVKGDSLQARLLTREVRYLGLDEFRDVYADGDNAMLKLDGGRDLNGNGYVDVVTPGDVSYGFEFFGDKSSPLIGPGGIGGPRGDGEFIQTIDTTGLEEGYHFLDARAYRHRTDGGPAVFSTWKKTIYVDRLPPISGLNDIIPVNVPGAGDHDVLVRSLDHTGDSVHVFLNLGAAVSDADVLAMAAAGGGQADKVDLDLFKKYFAGIPKGNNAFTVVTYEVTGTSNVQRFAGQWIDGRGAGLGDLNFDGAYQPDDMAFSGYSFEGLLYTQNQQFNPAADVNADGLIDNRDLYAMHDVYVTAGASQPVLDEWHNVLVRRGDVNQNGATDAYDIDYLYDQFGSNAWITDLDVDQTAGQSDVDLLVHLIFGTEYGDVNLDGSIDFGDLALLAPYYNQPEGDRWSHGDFNGSHTVDMDDLEIMAMYFGWTPTNGPIGVTAEQLAAALGQFQAPEPGTLGMVVVGGVVLLRRRRRRVS